MKVSRITAVLVFFLLSVGCIYGQYNEVEQTEMFKSRIDNPVEVKLFEKADKYELVAFNRSFYSYTLNVEYTSLINLTPLRTKEKYIVTPGRNSLITFYLQDKERTASIQYHTSYFIGVPSNDVIFDFPYLIPVKDSFRLDTAYAGQHTYFNDAFCPDNGDTIFCMRRGRVAAVPNLYHNADRISRGNSLEVVHDDGTIMIYENIAADSVLVQPSELVYPSQPLGIIKSGLPLTVSLYMITKDGRLKRQGIYYFINQSKIEKFSVNMTTVPVIYPDEVVIKEMTKKEKKAFSTGKLF